MNLVEEQYRIARSSQSARLFDHEHPDFPRARVLEILPIERGPIDGRCPGRSINVEFIDTLVWADIERFLRDPGDVLDELDASRERDAQGAIDEAQLITLKGALESLEAQRARAVSLAVSPGFDSGRVAVSAAALMTITTLTAQTKKPAPATAAAPGRWRVCLCRHVQRQAVRRPFSRSGRDFDHGLPPPGIGPT